MTDSSCSMCGKKEGVVPIEPTPFDCSKCRRVSFRWKACWDYVFVWPIPLPELFEENGTIVRPDWMRDVRDEVHGRSDFGIILTCGSGYVGKDNLYHPVKPLEPGTHVVYDKYVPRRVYEMGTDGQKHLVVICGYFDVRGLVEDE